MEEKFLSPKQLCDRWNIAMSTLYLRIVESDFPAKVKIGNATRFKLSDIESYENANVEETAKV